VSNKENRYEINKNKKLKGRERKIKNRNFQRNWKNGPQEARVFFPRR
jgi:hypothetical protein